LIAQGTGKAFRQRETVQGRITDGTLFLNISAVLGNHLNQLTETIIKDLSEKFFDELEDLRSDLEIILDNAAESVELEDSVALKQLSENLEELEARYARVVENVFSFVRGNPALSQSLPEKNGSLPSRSEAADN
jgi:hypothetical protein